MRPSEEAGENVYPRGTRMPPRDRRVLQTCQLCSMPCALGTSELLPSTCTGIPRSSAASPLPGPLFFPTPSPLNTLCLQTSTRPSVLTLNIPSEKLSILSLPRMRLSGPSLAFFPRGATLLRRSLAPCAPPPDSGMRVTLAMCRWRCYSSSLLRAWRGTRHLQMLGQYLLNK